MDQMTTLELNASIDKDGKFSLHNRDRFLEWCRGNKDRKIEVRFGRKYSKRSHPQNKYYWGVLIKEVAIRLRELGNDWLTDDDVHEMMKMKFNCKLQPNTNTGETVEIPKSTTSLTTTEFNEFMERIRMWASDFLEIYIPDPNEKLTLNI